MIVVVVLSTVMLVLALTVTANALHSDESTSRDRRWNTALAVAEAGVERTFDQHAQNVFDTGTPAALSGQLPGGHFSASIIKCSGVNPAQGCDGRGRLVIDSTASVPSASAAKKVSRRLRVAYASEPIFRYALFGNDDLDLGNQNTVPVLCANTPNIIGDVFANRSITAGNNWHIKGNIVTHSGPVVMGSNTCISTDTAGFGGSVYTGGTQTSGASSGFNLGQSSRVQGDVEVRADCASGVPPSRYNLTLASNIVVDGAVVLPPTGSQNGATTFSPPKLRQVCKQRFGSIPLPPLPDPVAAATKYALVHCPSSLPPSPSSCAKLWTGPNAAANFLASLLPGMVVGYHYVDAPNSMLDLRGKTINGDFVLRATGGVTVGGSVPAPFYQGRGTDFSGCASFPCAGEEIEVQILSERNPTPNAAACPTPSYDQDLTLDSNLNFNIQVDPASDRPAVLFYSRGCAKVNQQVTIPGALYSRGLNGGNNLSIVYNPAVEKTIGVGTKSLVRDETVELPAA